MEESLLPPQADAIRLAARHSTRDVTGPLVVDQAIRQAIQHCWMTLPEAERSPTKVEQEILRLVRRALRDMKQDAAAFGFGSGNTPGQQDKRLTQIRARYPKAYEKWADDEDSRLKQKFSEGATIEDLAAFFQRR